MDTTYLRETRKPLSVLKLQHEDKECIFMREPFLEQLNQIQLAFFLKKYEIFQAFIIWHNHSKVSLEAVTDLSSTNFDKMLSYSNNYENDAIKILENL